MTRQVDPRKAEFVGVRVEEQVVRAIDDEASKHEVTRAEELRRILETWSKRRQA